jgi:predicted transcriptional regulator
MHLGAEVMEVIRRVVRDFIGAYVNSLETLDILLHLQRNQEKAWGVVDLTTKLAMSEDVVLEKLDGLTQAGIVIKRTVSSQYSYLYGPSDRVIAMAVEELVAAHANSPPQVRAMILSSTPPSAKSYRQCLEERSKKE